MGEVAVGNGLAAERQPVESTRPWDASRSVSLGDSRTVMLTSVVKLVYDTVQKCCEAFRGCLGVGPQVQHVLQTFRAFKK